MDLWNTFVWWHKQRNSRDDLEEVCVATGITRARGFATVEVFKQEQ